MSQGKDKRTDRIRVYFDATPELRLAVKHAALNENKTVTDWLTDLITEAVGPKYLQKAREILAREKSKD
ncbi:MAG TPA: hypothetical protein VD994_05365 [Prosthecobacter sp.]|nr:hypothetical protein [Prosthecobacter sp.]